MAGMIIFYLVNSICILVYISIGIYAWRKDTPMWFYSGSEERIEKETFTDVKAFNHRNALMWIVSGLFYLLPIFLQHVITAETFIILYLIIVVGGFIVMMVYYHYLHSKYTK